MVFSWLLGKRRHEAAGDGHENPAPDIAATIHLKVEGGLLMAFGPEDDPMPPSLVRSVCAGDPMGTLQLENGETVDRRRVLDVLDAQQIGSLADEPNDGWIEAMLCLGGAFELTPPKLLDEEPLGAMPALPEGDDGQVSTSRPDPETEVITPLAFNADEQRSMAKADALLVNGLKAGISLSAGRYDPAIDGWVVRPDELASLAVQRRENAARTIDIDVTAITLQQDGRRWPVTARTIDLA